MSERAIPIAADPPAAGRRATGDAFERPDTPARGAPHRRRRRLILVVDDDADVREAVRGALEFDGYRVVTAEDGAAGLAALEHVAPCVVLLDMHMPNVDGWEFSRRYRAAAGHAAPIVVMAGATDAQSWRAEIGADACLPKPFRLAELQGLVAGYCGRVP